MDADNEKHIKEQLQLVEDNQQAIQHATKKQLKIINATIAHIDSLENIIERNDKLFQNRIAEVYTQQELTDLFTITNAIITDLIRDIENVLEYLTYIRKGALHPKLMPVEAIITQLKDATQRLPRGSYFPFRIHAEDWLEIEEHITISAFCDKTTIYTILHFPLISQPTYDILNVKTLPVINKENIFTETQVDNKILAIDREKLTYLLISKEYLNKCTNVKSQYICQNAMPIYRVNSNAPCEIQMYVQRQSFYHFKCQTKHSISNETVWITLEQPYTWLYSTAINQQITIQCDKQNEQKLIIKNTGKISLKGNCKLTTADMTIQSKGSVYETDIDSFLPEVNMTLLHETIPHNITFESVLQHRAELIELKSKVQRIDGSLENKEQMFFAQKQFVYPMTTSGIITIIVVAIIVYIIIRHKKKKIRLPVVIYEDGESYKTPNRPKSILKRSLSNTV